MVKQVVRNSLVIIVVMHLFVSMVTGQSYRLAFSTFFGGSAGDNPDGIRVDPQGNLVLFGQTGSANFPVSSNTYQSTKGAKDDAVIVILSPNLDRFIYSTFLGGSGNDAGRAGCIGRDGSMIVAGSSSGEDWPTKSAFQGACRGPGDAIIAKLSFQTAVDFNLDGNVNFKDFVKLGRYWFQDEPSVDIAPLPFSLALWSNWQITSFPVVQRL